MIILILQDFASCKNCNCQRGIYDNLVSGPPKKWLLFLPAAEAQFNPTIRDCQYGPSSWLDH
jgi:hypothetical protein